MSIPAVSKAIKHVLTTRANELAHETGLIQRRVKVTGATFSQALVLGWLDNPDATLEELAQMAAAVGLTITPQGLEQRFTRVAAVFLQRLLEAAVAETITADPVALPVLQCFAGVFIDDSTIVSLPDGLADVWAGCGGSGAATRAALKLQVRWDMLAGALDGPHLSDGRTHDRVAAQVHDDLPPGALRIADLGYWKLDTLAQLAADGVYWLSRLQIQTAVFNGAGTRLALPTCLLAQSGDQVDLAVELGVTARIPARLLAQRVPPDVAQERRRRLVERARRKGQPVSPTRLALAEWTLLVTNVPVVLLTLDDALVLARMRWQIELLFKLWKTYGHVDASRSRKPWRILCEVYAKLIAMLIQQWTFLISNWAFPDRSLFKATRTVSRHALLLAVALPSLARLQDALRLLQRCLRAGCRINTSVQAPRTYQLLLALDSQAP